MKKFLAAILLSICLLFSSLVTSVSVQSPLVLAKVGQVTAASPAGSPTPTPKPEFRLQAGSGKFPPGSPLHFMDGVINNVKLFFTFSTDGKILKRMSIADKDMIFMKWAVEGHNQNNLQTAVTDYKAQIAAVQDSIRKRQLSDDMKEKVKMDIWDQEQAYLYLFANANDKESPLLHDAWSQVENLKLALQ